LIVDIEKKIPPHRAVAPQNLTRSAQTKVGMIVHTRRPEMSEYFLAGLKDGGASMVLSKTERS
jgi:hypothetical protein